MRNITLFTNPTEDSHVFEITWSTKKSVPQGILRVTVHPRWEVDRKIIAEIAAIYHLVETKGLASNLRCGKGTLIKITSGAIRKAVKGQSDKQHLDTWVHFLSTAYNCAEFEVIKTNPLTDEPETPLEIEHIQADQSRSVFVESKLGPVIITRHALQRQAERTNTTYMPTAWKSLLSALIANDTAEIQIPKQKEERNRLKYGKGCQMLYHSGSKSLMVLVPGPEGKKLVTVLLDSEWNTYRKDGYLEKV